MKDATLTRPDLLTAADYEAWLDEREAETAQLRAEQEQDEEYDDFPNEFWE